MTVLTVIIDDIFPVDDATIVVNYRWFAIEGTNNEQDSASREFQIKPNAAQMNQDVLDDAIARASQNGLTVLSADRKLLVGGIQ